MAGASIRRRNRRTVPDGTECVPGDETYACCGNVCSDLYEEPSCGACGVTCDATEMCCRGEGCFDLTTSTGHCGGCFHVCDPGETCFGGTCCPEVGSACQGDDECCAGHACCEGQRAPEGTVCDPGSSCRAGENCLEGAVRLATRRWRRVSTTGAARMRESATARGAILGTSGGTATSATAAGAAGSI
jgi:hypothetical protein